MLYSGNFFFVLLNFILTNVWQYSAKFIPDEDGEWEFGLNLAGRGNMFLDRKLVIDLSAAPFNPDALFGAGTQDMRSFVKDLKAGQAYDLEIRISNADFANQALPFPFWGVIRAGGIKNVDGDAAIQQAVELAKESDGQWSFSFFIKILLNHYFIFSCNLNYWIEQRVCSCI